MNNQASTQADQDGYAAEAAGALQTTRIIYFAFLARLVSFTIVALFLAPVGAQPPAGGGGGTGGQATPLISMIAAGYAVVSIGPSFLLRRKTSGGSPEQVTTGILIQGAMLEGAALFGTVAYLIEASPMALIVSGLWIVLWIVTLPSRKDFGIAEVGPADAGGKRFGSDV